jgi:hypothetical protein
MAKLAPIAEQPVHAPRVSTNAIDARVYGAGIDIAAVRVAKTFHAPISGLVAHQRRFTRRRSRGTTQKQTSFPAVAMQPVIARQILATPFRKNAVGPRARISTSAMTVRRTLHALIEILVAPSCVAARIRASYASARGGFAHFRTIAEHPVGAIDREMRANHDAGVGGISKTLVIRAR